MYRFPSLLVLLLLLITTFEVSGSGLSIGSRSLLQKLDDSGGDNDVAVDLNDTNFKNVLNETPAPFAIVEFFAHWCPACRNYKPHYEKVARIFNGPNAAHPGIIFMARVDCALKINTQLCDRFSVDRYPSLVWGRPSKFASISKWDGSDGELMSIKGAHTAEHLLLHWINKKTISSFGFENKKDDREHLKSDASDLEQVSMPGERRE